MAYLHGCSFCGALEEHYPNCPNTLSGPEQRLALAAWFQGFEWERYSRNVCGPVPQALLKHPAYLLGQLCGTKSLIAHLLAQAEDHRRKPHWLHTELFRI